MATFREFLANLEPEDRDAFMQEIHARLALAERKASLGPFEPLATGAIGTARGLGDSIMGLALLPHHAAEALRGESGISASDRPLTPEDITTSGKLGQFGGFLASIPLTRGLGTGRVATRLLPGTGFAARATRGALEFGTTVATRTPEPIPDRVAAFTHALPAGALFGALGRTRGLVTADNRLITGTAVDKFLARNSLPPANKGGIVAAIEAGLARDAEGVLRYAAANTARQGAAGFFTPGFSPIEITGQPNIDSAIFNAGTAGAFGLLEHRIPRGLKERGERSRLAREAAERAAAAAREPARTINEGRQLSLFPRDVVAGEPGLDPRPVFRNTYDAAGKVIGFELIQQELPGLTPEVGTPLHPSDRPYQRQDLFTGRFSRKMRPEAQRTQTVLQFDPAPKEAVPEPGPVEPGTPVRTPDGEGVATITSPDGRQNVLFPNGSNRTYHGVEVGPTRKPTDSTLNNNPDAPLYPDIPSLPTIPDVLRPITSATNIVAMLVRNAMAAKDAAGKRNARYPSEGGGVRAYPTLEPLINTVYNDLRSIARTAFTDKPIHVVLSTGYGTEGRSAAWEPSSSTLIINPQYFTNSPAARAHILAHEIAHARTLTWAARQRLASHTSVLSPLLDFLGFTTLQRANAGAAPLVYPDGTVSNVGRVRLEDGSFLDIPNYSNVIEHVLEKTLGPNGQNYNWRGDWAVFTKLTGDGSRENPLIGHYYSPAFKRYHQYPVSYLVAAEGAPPELLAIVAETPNHPNIAKRVAAGRVGRVKEEVYLPITSHNNYLTDATWGVPSSYLERIRMPGPLDIPFPAEHLQLQPINDRFYAYRSVAEYIAEGTAEAFLNGGRARTRETQDLLDKVYGSSTQPVLLGAEGTRQQLLFERSAFGGPAVEGSFSLQDRPRELPVLPGQELGYRVELASPSDPVRDYLVTDDSPFLMEEGARHKWVRKTLTAYHPGTVSISQQQLESVADPVIAMDSIFNSALDRLQTESAGLESPKAVEARLVELLKLEAREQLPGRGESIREVTLEAVTQSGDRLVLTDLGAKSEGFGENRSTYQPTVYDAVPALPEAESPFTRRGKRRTSIGGRLIFEYSANALKILEEKLGWAFENGGALLESAIPDATMREIVRLRFGASRHPETGAHLFVNQDGVPVAERVHTAAEIAGKLGISTRTVNDRLVSFALDQTVNVPGGLYHPRLRVKGAERLDLAPPVESPVTREVKTTRTFRPRVEGREQRRRIPREQTVTENGTIVERRLFSQEGSSRTARSLPGTVIYYHPETGRTITRQSGLFEAKATMRAVAEAERTAGIETAEAQPNFAEAAGSAVEGTTIQAALAPPREAPAPRARKGRTARKDPKAGQQRRLVGPGFGLSRAKDGDARFTSNDAARKQIILQREARTKVGKPGLTKPQFLALDYPTRIEHAVRRFNAASSEKQHRRALRKYGDLLNNPTMIEMGKVKRAGEAHQLLLEAASAASIDVMVGTTPVRGRGGIRLVERETGRETNVPDIGTAAIIVNDRARLLRDAPDLTDPVLRFIRMDLPGEGGGPRGPVPPDTAMDAEAGGIPPSTELNRGEFQFIAQSRLRSVRDFAGTVTRTLEKNVPATETFFHIFDSLIQAVTKARTRASVETTTMDSRRRAYRIAKNRGDALGEAAAALDLAGYELIKEGKTVAEAKAHIDAIETSLYEGYGLGSNEVSFLKAMRPTWDKMFRRFGIGFETYIPGYFARYASRHAIDDGVLYERTNRTGLRDFFALHERTGELGGRRHNYFEVFDAYARTGWRYRFLTETPGSGREGILERATRKVASYGVKQGDSIVLPTWMAPFEAAIDRAKGLPDAGQKRMMDAKRARMIRMEALEKKAAEALRSVNSPVTKTAADLLQRHYESLGVRIERPYLDTWVDYVVSLNRGRTFGLHVMRAVRHVTQSSFFVLPRVGPQYFTRALRDLLSPETLESSIAEASAAGAIKQAFYVDYVNSKSKLISSTEKLSFIYSKLDVWERALSYRAQRLKSTDALTRYKARSAGTDFAKNFDLYAQESGLNQLSPGWHAPIRDLVRRGSYAEAARQHARLLVDHAIFDYSRTNAPLWRGSMWGRLFGQYGSWPLGAIETMHGMVRYGSTRDKLQIGGTYAAVAASIYGMGQAMGVETKDWIPFVHAIVYTGGPALSLAEDLKAAVSGDPFTQDMWASDFQHEPIATLLGPVARTLVPAGDVMEALAAETNLTRRQRRLYGVPRRSFSQQEFLARLFGFRPITDATHHAPLPKKAAAALADPLAGAPIRKAVGTERPTE